MSKNRAARLLVLSFAAVLLSGLQTGSTDRATGPKRLPPHDAAGGSLKSYGNLSMAFEPNQGQTDERVRFLTRGQGYTLLLSPSEAVLALRHPPRPGREPESA